MNDRLRQQRDMLALGGFTIDLLQGELLDAAGHRVALRRQSLSVLLELARQPGRVLTRQALAALVWKDTVVTDDSLVQCIVEIRRALGPVAGAALKTVPRRGYVLEVDAAALVTSAQASAPVSAHAPSSNPSAPLGVLSGLAEAAAALPHLEPHALPFVGREAEVARLTHMAGGAGTSHNRLWLISGEPGIGKSRLIDEAAAAAATVRGASVVALKCHEIESSIAYGALSQLIERLVAAADDAALRPLDATSRAELAALAPWCSERLAPLAPLDTAEAHLRQARLRAALVHLCELVSAGHSVIICIDDAHWLDEASAVALFAVLAAEARHTCTFWATLREDEVARNPNAMRLVAALEELPGTQRLPLQRLAPEHIEHIVRALHPLRLAGTSGAASDETRVGQLVERLVRESAGNPFYLRELLHAALPGVQGLPPSAEAPAAGDGSASPVLPRGILEAVLRRARHLPKPAVRLLEAGAVLEQSARFDVLCAVAKLERHAGLEALEVLMSTHWLVEERERARYPFAHDKLREAIYASLPAVQLRALHGRAAHALLDEAQHRTQAPEHAVVATHAHRAGFDALAFTQFALAGDAARRMFELRRADALYSQALGLDIGATEASAALERVALLEKRGAVRSMLGAAAGAETDLRIAIALVEAQGAPSLSDAASGATLVRLLIELGVMLQRHNRLEDAQGALRRALQIASAANDPGAIAAARCWLGDVEWMREHIRDARAHFEAVLSSPVAASPAAAPLLTKALFGLAQCAGMDARPGLADKLLDQALARAQAPAERFFQCAWGVLKGWVRVGGHGMDEPQEALGHFERCLSLARESDLFWYAAPCEIGIGVVHATLGLCDTALEYLEPVLKLPADAHNGRWRLAAGVWLAWCHLERREPAAALAAARQAQRALGEFGSFMFAAMLPALVTMALVRLGRGAECEDPLALVEQARRDELGYVLVAALESRVEWLLAQGEAEQALACAEELRHEAAERGLPRAMTSAVYWRARALVVAAGSGASDGRGANGALAAAPLTGSATDALPSAPSSPDASPEALRWTAPDTPPEAPRKPARLQPGDHRIRRASK